MCVHGAHHCRPIPDQVRLDHGRLQRISANLHQLIRHPEATFMRSSSCILPDVGTPRILRTSTRQTSGDTLGG